MATQPDEVPSLAEVREFATDWYRKLDEHAPSDVLVAMVAPDIELQLPEGVILGVDGFRRWYEAVTRIFFDEVHVLRSVDVSWRDGTAFARVVVNWQAKRWQPPAPRSQWIGFDAFQDWEVRRDEVTGRRVITRYVVNELRPMPGSPPL